MLPNNLSRQKDFLLMPLHNTNHVPYDNAVREHMLDIHKQVLKKMEDKTIPMSEIVKFANHEVEEMIKRARHAMLEGVTDSSGQAKRVALRQGQGFGVTAGDVTTNWLDIFTANSFP